VVPLTGEATKIDKLNPGVVTRYVAVIEAPLPPVGAPLPPTAVSVTFVHPAGTVVTYAPGGYEKD
jgi:hypothetical protein